MPTGRLINYNPDKGYGFIAAEPENVFVHATTLEAGGVAQPRRGNVIAYELGAGLNGRVRAVKASLAVEEHDEAASRVGPAEV